MRQATSVSRGGRRNSSRELPDSLSLPAVSTYGPKSNGLEEETEQAEERRSRYVTLKMKEDL